MYIVEQAQKKEYKETDQEVQPMAGSNYRNQSYTVDMVFCIDATGSMEDLSLIHI